MFAIHQNTSTAPNCTPNILPCKVNHNGPVDASKRYWDPVQDDEKKDTSVVYFRGRKLCGHNVALPDNYQGVVLQKTDKILPQQQQLPTDRSGEPDESDSETEEPRQDVRIMQQLGSFDSINVWGHESLPAEADDAYIKGVQEWLSMASALHSYDSPTEQPSTR